MNRFLSLIALLSTSMLIAPSCAQHGNRSYKQTMSPLSNNLTQTRVTPETTATSLQTVPNAPEESLAKKFKIDSRFEPVVQMLVRDGWPEEFVRERFADERTEFLPRMVSVTIKKKGGSSGSAYSWVNTKESAKACSTFIAKYDTILREAHRLYGVEPELVAALMYCETRHGAVTGNHHVFSVYASMVLMNEPEFLQQNIERAEETLASQKANANEVREQLEYVRARSKKKANWAYDELRSLLKIHRDGHLDAMKLYGSWAGAFGWSQFIPSSYLRRAVDGDGDKVINLFNPADAIHSVANYLKSAGYRSGSSKSARTALFDYNNSTPYVTSIMGLASRLKSTK